MIKEQLSEPILLLPAIILVFAFEKLHFLEKHIRPPSDEIYVKPTNKIQTKYSKTNTVANVPIRDSGQPWQPHRLFGVIAVCSLKKKKDLRCRQRRLLSNWAGKNRYTLRRILQG